mgnify:CR=1 FL=1|jgi:N-acylneuraminate cytidylyltransferase
MAFTIAACRRCALIDRVIVSTDSAEYGEIARCYGAEVPFLRPAELAESDSPDIGFIVHALDWLVGEGREPTNVVHMRPTTPFRNPRLVDDAIRSFVVSSDATALRSVHEMSQSAYKSLEVAPSGWLRPMDAVDTAMDEANLGRQSFPTTFMANGYVDVVSVEFIRATGLLHGDRVLPFRTPPVLEVDTEDDMERLEFQLTKDPGLLATVFV